MGVVYLAQDPQIERLLALKTIRFDGPGQTIGKDEAKARFLKEAKLSGRLQHPNIVTVYDVGEDGGTLFLAMELVSGGSFQQKLADPTSLPVHDRIRIVAEVADALAHGHERGVIHRDVKPANILLTETLSAKLTDFGIGKLVTGDTDLTSTGQMVGSPAYMSPEQIRGEKLDVRSDIFSLGVVLFQALTFKKPFPAETLTSLVYQILHEEPPDPAALVADLPPEIGEIVRGCLSKKREARYADAAALAEDLRAVLGISPVGATGTFSESKVRRSGGGSLSGTGGVGSSSASGAAPVPGPAPVAPVAAPEKSGPHEPSVTSGSLPPPLPPGTGSRPAHGSNARTFQLVAAGAAVVILAAVGFFALRRSGANSSGAAPTPSSASPTPSGPGPAPTSGPAAQQPTPVPTPEPVPEPTKPPPIAVAVKPTPQPTRTPRPTAVPTRTVPPTPVPTEVPKPVRKAANLTLSARRTVRINVSPDQARVFLDGKLIGISDDWDDSGGGSLVTFDKDGTHRFRFAYPGLRDLIVDVNVSPGAKDEQVEIEAKMETGTPDGPTGPPGKLKRPDYKTQGAIRFDVDPPDTNLTINGIALGPVSQWVDKDLELQAPGVHEVALSAPGREPKVLRVIAAQATGKQVAKIKERLKKN